MYYSYIIVDFLVFFTCVLLILQIQGERPQTQVMAKLIKTSFVGFFCCLFFLKKCIYRLSPPNSGFRRSSLAIGKTRVFCCCCFSSLHVIFIVPKTFIKLQDLWLDFCHPGFSSWVFFTNPHVAPDGPYLDNTANTALWTGGHHVSFFHVITPSCRLRWVLMTLQSVDSQPS